MGRQVDVWIDRAKPIAAFRNFVKALEKIKVCRDLSL